MLFGSSYGVSIEHLLVGCYDQYALVYFLSGLISNRPRKRRSKSCVEYLQRGTGQDNSLAKQEACSASVSL